MGFTWDSATADTLGIFVKIGSAAIHHNACYQPKALILVDAPKAVLGLCGYSTQFGRM